MPLYVLCRNLSPASLQVLTVLRYSGGAFAAYTAAQLLAVEDAGQTMETEGASFDLCLS